MGALHLQGVLQQSRDEHIIGGALADSLLDRLHGALEPVGQGPIRILAACPVQQLRMRQRRHNRLLAQPNAQLALHGVCKAASLGEHITGQSLLMVGSLNCWRSPEMEPWTFRRRAEDVSSISMQRASQQA